MARVASGVGTCSTLLRFVDGDPVRENPVMLKFKALDVATAAIDRPLRIRGIKPRGNHALQMFYFQRQ